MKSEKPVISYHLLKDYFEGNVSSEERKLVEECFERQGNSLKFESCLHEFWKDTLPDDTESEAAHNAMLDRIHHTIHLKSREKGKIRIREVNKQTIIPRLKNLGKIAAILLVPLLIYNGWITYMRHSWIKNQEEIVYNEIKCPLGSQSNFNLPDGTTGKLNNGSSLKYPTRFTGEIREVELSGEAYFDIEFIPKKPFIIKTAGLDVKVLGTSLNIYAYPDERYQEVTLESGSVELIKQEAEGHVTVARMLPGQHAVYDYSQEELYSKNPSKDMIIVNREQDAEQPIDKNASPYAGMLATSEEGLYLAFDKTEKYTGWTKGRLILRNDPMPVLLKRMERWYSVKFNINDERIYDYSYWATFEEESLDQVLKLLSFTGPVQFTKRPREKEPDGTLKTLDIDVTINLP